MLIPPLERRRLSTPAAAFIVLANCMTAEVSSLSPLFRLSSTSCGLSKTAYAYTMCGRFALAIHPELLMKAYGLSSSPELSPRYNIAPGQQILAVKKGRTGLHEWATFKWGLVPSWAKDPSIGFKMINARSETAHVKPSFRRALRSRRCLIPASGFYEWEKKGAEKIPHYIYPADGGLISFAGLWEAWDAPNGEDIISCTILTRPAKGLVERIHDRMPVLVRPEDFDPWLSNKNLGLHFLERLFDQPPPESLNKHVVSKEVNHTNFDSPQCIKAVSLTSRSSSVEDVKKCD